YDAVGPKIDLHSLYLDEDLLELTALQDAVGNTITASYYVLRPLNRFPKHRIDLRLSSPHVWGYAFDTPASVSVAGVWGYHDDWTHAFVDTADTVVGLSGNTLTVEDVDGVNLNGDYRFEVGMMLQIESEYLWVVDIDPDFNVLTVVRGVR